MKKTPEDMPFKNFIPGQAVKHKVWGEGKIVARWEDEGLVYVECAFKEGRKTGCLSREHGLFKLLQNKDPKGRR
ncbi:MAG: hypothetical protein FWF59_11570 [Turicibacter sp.]|nr:hypothetical protein [Turicibacter sp.]